MYHHFFPGMMAWWKQAHNRGEGGGECGAQAGCGPSGSEDPYDREQRGSEHGGQHHGGWRGGWRAGGDDGGGAFGVRRPLRFLAYQLDLDQAQVGELAKILNDLKTERAQAEVDGRRTVATFADAVAGDAFDATKANEGAALRVKSAERLRDAVVAALGRIHAVLKTEQRQRLAYLIRTGTVTL